ncbi:MAG: acyl-CoA dehydrogenase family protein, partial [Myxococcales bacterium]|nr:acyl-CoA dehydrogenase family protein [Myxococcales bacterium]
MVDDFRGEVRAWLEENAPASLRGQIDESGITGYWGGRRREGVSKDTLLWLERMAARGWTAPTWPREYGGGGLSRKQARIIDEERVRLRVPPPLIGFGLKMIGPTLLEYGTEAQKQRHLTKIIRGEIRWCQGYSEPGSGSDLASLQTKAVRDGDTFLINGQKVWTSYADKSDWMFCLVRTNPDAKKQAGITFLLFDLDQPGVTIRPIPLISGASPFCEVFFEDVRAKVEDVIYKIDAGWTVAKALLGHERTWIGELFTASVSGGEAQLVALARRHLGPAAGPIADPLLRDEIARAAMDEQTILLTLERARQQVRDGRPGPESSILKIAGTEINQRRRDLAARIAGPQSLGWEGPGFDDEALDITRQWLRSRGNTIEGGTSEIQLNI